MKRRDTHLFTPDDSIRLAGAVADYLAPFKNALVGYAWPMPDSAVAAAQSLGLSFGNEGGGVAATHALRAAVASRVREVHVSTGKERTAQLEALCSFVVRDWGGLGRNLDTTIARYAAQFTSSRIPDLCAVASLEQLRSVSGCAFPFSGISSWSKWLNFVWRDWALIYDARTAFALNAIHFMRRVDAPVFHVPQGRAALLSAFDTQTLAAMRRLSAQGKRPPANHASNSAFMGWLRGAAVHPGSTYVYYLDVMQRVRDLLGMNGEHALVETEMLLFHMSEGPVVRDLISSLSPLVADAMAADAQPSLG